MTAAVKSRARAKQVGVRASALLSGVVLLAAVAHLAFDAPSRAQPAPAACSGNIVVGGQFQSLALQSGLPNGIGTASQINADCMAWQTFIALNWNADPNNPGAPDPSAGPSTFGTSTATTVWESYFPALRLFQDTQVSLATWKDRGTEVKRSFRTGKSTYFPSFDSFQQALDQKWLTNQWGNLTYYEVLVNQDLFEFTLNPNNNLTTAANQLVCANNSSGGGFILPAGGYGGNQDFDCQGNVAIFGQNVGAIEIKAAWTLLPVNDRSFDYRFKTSQVTINGVTLTFGLVGLHIVHMVPGQSQMLWATFEHIDNSPDDNHQGGSTPPTFPLNPNQVPRNPAGYTFFNPNCDLATDRYNCENNKLPGTPCALPRQANCDPYSAPIQVTRISPVDTKANSVTGQAWSLMPKDSVFNYYRLISVMWTDGSTRIQPGAMTPLTDGDIQPPASNGRVVNTTLETYVQNSSHCMDCHRYAPISYYGQQSPSGAPFASSYSFIFSTFTNR